MPSAASSSMRCSQRRRGQDARAGLTAHGELRRPGARRCTGRRRRARSPRTGRTASPRRVRAATHQSSCPARAWRAISRSEIRRQTQTIMVGSGRVRGVARQYKCESIAFATTVSIAARQGWCLSYSWFPSATSSSTAPGTPPDPTAACLLHFAHLRLQVVLQPDLGEQVDLGFEEVDVLLGVVQDLLRAGRARRSRAPIRSARCRP